MTEKKKVGRPLNPNGKGKAIWINANILHVLKKLFPEEKPEKIIRELLYENLEQYQEPSYN